MAIPQEHLDFIAGQFDAFGPITVKRMFGGAGIFHEGLMIAMVNRDLVLRLKVDEHNQADYEARGMKPFSMGGKKKGMPYWEVPQDVVENRDQLAAWARKSYEAAVRSKKK